MVRVIKTYPGQPLDIARPMGWRYHYIGREWAGFPESIFHNPFHLGHSSDRKRCLEKFVFYWYASEQAWLRKEAMKIINTHDVLACWCKPLDCHGDIIAGYVNWKLSQNQMRLFL